MLDNPEGGESDPADDIRRRCKENFPSVLSCIRKRTREGCDQERVMRKISSPGSIAGYLIFTMTWASGLGTWTKGNVALVFPNGSASSFREVQRDRGPTGSLEPILVGWLVVGIVPIFCAL